MSRLSDFNRAPEFCFRFHFMPPFRLAFALSFFAATSLVYGQEESATAVSHHVKEVFERAAKAVVKIHGVDEHSPICGTGFFIDPTGTLYTAYTVGGEAGNFTIEFGGKKYPARQLLADIRSGTAMLKIDAPTPALPIGKSEGLEVATPVLAVGYPLDLPETPNFGMIAGFDRKYLGRYFSTTHLRVNLPTQRGEAGAPLLNMKVRSLASWSAVSRTTQRVTRCQSRQPKNSGRFHAFRRSQTWLDRDQCHHGAATSGRFGCGNEADHGRHASRPFRNQIRRHSPASRQEESNAAGRCAGCLVLHHCRRHRSDYCDARKSKTDFQCAGNSSSRQPERSVACLSRHARNKSAGDPALARFRRATHALNFDRRFFSAAHPDSAVS